MELDLNVNIRENSNIPVIDLEGEIDVYTYPILSDAIQNVLDNPDNFKNVIINLEKVRYIDSTGLGVIANSANQISKRTNGHITIINASPPIKKIFDVSGLGRANFNLYDNEESAIQLLVTKKDS